MNDIIDSNDNDNDMISWITLSAQGWLMPLGKLCLDCSFANKTGKWKFWMNLEMLSSHDEVKTDPHSKSLLENAQNSEKSFKILKM